MKVDFVKYSIFKAKITATAEKGVSDNDKIWFEKAKDEGLLTRAVKEEVKEPELPVENGEPLVDPEAFKSLI